MGNKERLVLARQLIQEKNYTEAKRILEGVDDPIAKEWLAKIDNIMNTPEQPQSPDIPPKYRNLSATSSSPNVDPKYRNLDMAGVQQHQSSKKMRSAKTWGRIWGVLALLVTAYLCWGVIATSMAVDEVVNDDEGRTEAQQSGAEVGAGIGASINFTFLACTGGPLLLFFAFMAWRNNVAFGKERRQQEMITLSSGYHRGRQ